jgi:4,5-DOPA dioxygenase extradiol
MKTMPPLYLSHGSPMTALEPREAGAFMQRLGPVLTEAFGLPQAVLVVSAHTLTREPLLLAAAQHEAVYDFGGFDQRLYTLRYDAPGAPTLALQVEQLLQAAQLPVHRQDRGGLDHGIWTPLRYMFPLAQVPVLPLGWPPHWTPAQLFALGRALAPLADAGVLVVGSGSITHNLQRVFAGGLRDSVDRPATPQSTAFRDWFVERAAQADWPALFNYRQQAPYAVDMHPTDEHLLPFFVAAGVAQGQLGLRIHDSLTYGELAMDAYAFGAQAPVLAQALSGH